MASKTLCQTDEQMMARALHIGERARYIAPPNPWVGCVITRDSEIVGEGWTQAFGGPHAEVQALKAAGNQAQGATAYVTLEPCSHCGHTGPCCEALIAAGVQRVVVAIQDEDNQVHGRGIRRLQEAGVSVDVGVGAEAAQRSLAPYLHHRATGRAYCVLKTAMSIDGRTAAADGSSQWITGKEARTDVHRWRDASQAVIVGSGTALADQPSLNVRHVIAQSPKPPLRVLLDSRGRVPATGPLFDRGIAPTLVFTTDSCPVESKIAWTAAEAEVVVLGESIDLKAVLDELGRRGVLQAFVEGGSTLHQSFFTEGLCNKLLLYIGPKVLGSGGPSVFPAPLAQNIDQARELRLLSHTALGDTLRLEYE